MIRSFKICVGLIVMLLCAVVSSAQSDDEILHESSMPKALRKAYKQRTVVIKNDTIVYRHRWFIPGQYKVQYAGSIGFMSIGFGYSITPIYQPSLFFGYLSENFGGSKSSVVSISLKNSFYLTKQPILKYVKPYAGISINWGNTHNTFNELPDYYPEKYYFQNKVHLAPFIGGELKFSINNKYFDGFGVYGELSSLDAYLLEAIRTDYVKLHMTLSLAVGVTFYLK